MTNEEILDLLSHQNYAPLYIQIDGQRVLFGPTRPTWIACLLRATSEQRTVLIEKLTRWHVLQSLTQ